MGQKRKLHECSKCGKHLSSKQSLGKHSLLHTRALPWKCDICEKKFLHKLHLSRHLKIHSLLEKPFACNVCQERFKSLRPLNSHMRSHSTDTKFECEQCGKCFRLKEYLQQHYKVHAEKVHVCDFCEKGFARYDQLNIHIRTHTLERPYKCSQCSKDFTQSHVLKWHLATHSDTREYKCSLCLKSFKLKKTLIQHVQGVHDGVKLRQLSSSKRTTKSPIGNLLPKPELME